jgi:hypothetical protein
MALVHRMPMVQPGPVERALADELRIGETHVHIPEAGREVCITKWADAELSELEAYIVHSIDHVGWYPYVWFPVVAREMLNFGSDDREEYVYAAIVSLIERGGLAPKRESPRPEWCPAPGIVEAAERKISEMRARLPPPFPDRFSERCHIFAHGDKFDVDAFMATSTLRPDYVWRRGPSGSSGIELFLGDGRQINLADQEGFCVGPSAELMRHALDVGILPFYYGTIDERGTRVSGR